MMEPRPLTQTQVAAANRIHARLKQWARADAALDELKRVVPGFGLTASLLKVVAVNALYGTNVYALHRMAEHVSAVLLASDARGAGLDLVDQLARIPKKEGETRHMVRTSFASKFCHFFVDAERFPIYDSYASRMLRFHLGRSSGSSGFDTVYSRFVGQLRELVDRSKLTGSQRELDRYLWVAGQYQAWTRNRAALLNAELKALFQAGDPNLAKLEVLA